MEEENKLPEERTDDKFWNKIYDLATTVVYLVRETLELVKPKKKSP